MIGALLIGIGAALARVYPYALPSLLIANENDIGPGIEEHRLFEDHAATTSANIHEGLINPEATATSSPRSIRVPVLIYHSVRPHIPKESPTQDVYDITPELLEQELSYIKAKGFTTVTFADVNAYFDEGTPLPAHPVILSFDDGWRNEYVYAFPLLKKFGMKGTFFIFTSPLDHRKAHWMTWEDVKELDRAGMEIGGHTRTHPVLSSIATDAGLDKEIAGGKAILEQHLGHPVTVFAYPFGARNARVIDAVKRAGYSLARTTNWGVWNDPEHRYKFHGTLSTDNIADFEKLLSQTE